MIVPDYWAEGRVQETVKGRTVTIRRFGWSQRSQLDAQQNANQRAQEALARHISGDTVRRLDHKVAYNGGEGLPIREEVISRHGEVVMTRNTYGARCLNTPNVLFADIDFADIPTRWASCTSFLIVWLVSGLLLFWWSGLKLALVASLFVAWASVSLFNWIDKRNNALYKLKEKVVAEKRIRDFSARNPNWHLRVYRTPAGLRLLVMHRTFLPDDPEIRPFFDEIGVDKTYVKMCLNQRCFRARLTAKPWRIGIKSHLRPRPGIWPVRPEWLPIREKWITEYEAKAADFAACSFLEALGSSSVHPEADAVRQLHDNESGALSRLLIA